MIPQKRYLLILFAVLAVFTVAAGMLAYTGPAARNNIAQTMIVRTQCLSTQYVGFPPVWRYRDWDFAYAAPGSAQALQWQAAYPYAPEHTGCNSSLDGQYGWGEKTVTLGSYAPVDFSQSLTCATPGSAGWCKGGLTQTMTASEPIPGYVVKLFETASGTVCDPVDATNVTCTRSITQQGSRSESAWAVSSYGDTSTMQTYSWSLDTELPVNTTTLSAADGLSGWYKTGISGTIAGSDGVSGLDSTGHRWRINGGAWQNGKAITISPDGIYLLETETRDNAGNIQSYAVTVKKDSVPPSLTLPYAPDGLNGWYKTPALIAPTASDLLSGLQSALVNGAPSITLAEGTQTVTGVAQDVAGNSTTISQVYRLDSTLPGLRLIAPSPDGLNGWYVSPVSGSLSGSDLASGVDLSSYRWRIDGGAWKTGTAVDVLAEGSHTIDAEVRDLAGNIRPYTTVIKKDTGRPSISLPYAPNGLNGWYNSLAVISPSASDPISGIQSALVNGFASITLAEGNQTVTGIAQDVAGNSTTVSQIYRTDVTAPGLNLTAPAPDGLNGWYISPVSGTFAGTDSTSGVDISSLRWMIDGGSWRGGGAFEISDDGSHDLVVSVTDIAGNSNQRAYIYRLDSVPPDINPSASGTRVNNWYRSTVTLFANASDVTSGIASVWHQADGSGTWFSGPNVTIASDGTHAVDFRAEDVAGHISETMMSVSIDRTAPTISQSVPAPGGENGWHVAPFTVALVYSDAVSGIAPGWPRYQVDTNPWSAGSSIRFDTDGIHDVAAQAQDVAGNVASSAFSVRLDQTPPSVSIPSNPDGQNGWYVTHPTITLAASDATSGVAGAAFDGYGADTVMLPDGTHPLVASAHDFAGNIWAVSHVVRVDTVSPALTPTIPAPGVGGWYSAPVTASANASDATSGLALVEYRVDGGAWQPGSTVTVSGDGEHSVQYRATDRAGNQATSLLETFRIDSTPPVSSFSNPPEGATIQVSKTFTFSGASADSLSGLSKVEISVDGGESWKALTLTEGRWTYTWDTRQAPHGTYAIQVRAEDMAGNQGSARAQVITANRPPRIDLDEWWWLWESGAVRVHKADIPIQSVEVKISCDPYHKDVILSYDADSLPSEIRWDRHCGEGVYAAESGDYRVSATVCDTWGRCSMASGVIRVPFFVQDAPPTPTPAPAATVTTQEREPAPTSPPVVVAMAPPALADVEPVAPPAEIPVEVLRWWHVSVLAGLVLFAAVGLFDPRPRALFRLAESIKKIGDYR